MGLFFKTSIKNLAEVYILIWSSFFQFSDEETSDSKVLSRNSFFRSNQLNAISKVSFLTDGFGKL